MIAPFLRVDGRSGSEITGPAFSPDGTRLYFSGATPYLAGGGAGVLPAGGGVLLTLRRRRDNR